MLRITPVTRPGQPARLQLDGRVGGAEVELLEREGGRCLEQTGGLVLDLDGVQFIDEAGMALFERWAEDGVVLWGGSFFVRSLLKAHGLGDR